MTTAYSVPRDSLVAAEGVYAPQADSQFLIDVMEKSGLALGRRVADLCTGSGVVAIAAGEQGASEVAAFDVCPQAVRCARMNALAVGVDVDVHLGSWARAAEFGPFDLVVCNPPYVPARSRRACRSASVDHRVGTRMGCRPRRPPRAGTAVARRCPTCSLPAAPFWSCNRSSPYRVETLATLSGAGLDAEVVAYQWIPFGPVLSSRAAWLEDTGRLEPGRREEELVVIRAEKP